MKNVDIMEQHQKECGCDCRDRGFYKMEWEWDYWFKRTVKPDEKPIFMYIRYNDRFEYVPIYAACQTEEKQEVQPEMKKSKFKWFA